MKSKPIVWVQECSVCGRIDISRDFAEDFRRRGAMRSGRIFREKCMDRMCGSEDCETCHPENFNNEQEDDDDSRD